MEWWHFLIIMVIWDVVRMIGTALLTKHLLRKKKKDDEHHQN